MVLVNDPRLKVQAVDENIFC